MSKLATKFQFYLSLYLSRFGILNGNFTEPSGGLKAHDCYGPKGRRIFFWTPAATAGAQVIVHDVLPEIISNMNELGLDWDVSAGAKVPAGQLDDLICFKAIPDATQRALCKRVVMLICDQADAYWSCLPDYDALVATSSHPFARLIAVRNPRTYFIGESEPMGLVAHGESELAAADFRERRDLVWHGGGYSLGALEDLRPMLGELDLGPDVVLRIVSGKGAPRSEQWGRLTVEFTPWSLDALQRAASTARLGLVPARSSLKSSWLKPASRVRRLYGMGVPAIGDGRVPDVVEFMRQFDGPMASNVREWMDTVQLLWGSPDRLAELAKAGHSVLKERFTTIQTGQQWLNFLLAAANGFTRGQG